MVKITYSYPIINRGLSIKVYFFVQFKLSRALQIRPILSNDD